jgi:PHD/YefM family antitoxin component YafN of YafNO toxin-antitoxin module
MDVLRLPEHIRRIVLECELTGMQTIFERSGRPAAILTSFDEYVALKETIAISNDARLRARMKLAETDEEPVAMLERLRIPKSVSVPEEAKEALRMIDDDPIAGSPLFEPLRGMWVLRAGPSLRVIYRIFPEAKTILILAITTVTE